MEITIKNSSFCLDSVLVIANIQWWRSFASHDIDRLVFGLFGLEIICRLAQLNRFFNLLGYLLLWFNLFSLTSLRLRNFPDSWRIKILHIHKSIILCCVTLLELLFKLCSVHWCALWFDLRKLEATFLHFRRVNTILIQNEIRLLWTVLSQRFLVQVIQLSIGLSLWERFVGATRPFPVIVDQRWLMIANLFNAVDCGSTLHIPIVDIVIRLLLLQSFKNRFIIMRDLLLALWAQSMI